MKMKLFFALCLFTFSQYLLPNKNIFTIPVADKPFVVVLDAGHGGHDPGNLGNGYLEKQIALNIVLKVGELLSANKDIKVIYTRKDDTFVDLYVRGEIANKANADLFVSVHCDSHSSDAHGAGTFVLGLHANKQNFEIAKKENSVIYLEDNYETRYADYDINSPESVIGLTIMQEEFLDQSIALAKMIQDNFSGKLKRNNRKVKQAGFIVLHQTFMPSVLVETGFLTNKGEGAYLNSKKGQSEMGRAIANAILKYKSAIAPNTRPPLVEGEAASNKDKRTVDLKETSTDRKEETTKKITAILEKSKDTPPVKTIEPVKDKVAEPIDIATKENKQKVENNTMEKREKKETEGIIFKVQLMASSKDLKLVPDNFNGLGGISKEPYNKLYRYMYGSTNSYKAAEKLQLSATIKGYTTAYIVAYKNGNRVPIPKVLQQVSQ
ncbi:N-acetylmuramoyl-L-alanine amidase family protein [Maribacter sp. 2304DJ31-5]|uniref:N-acetylmuramoyl-L-alanine amidase family protein n=1 Tax=Maribacter sp. 2304DJ31-5 TaxID=3386273 RepID=UPI0039BC6466